MNEKELILGLKQSSLSAYKTLFLEYYSIIHRFLTAIIKDDAAAEDVAQNIFLKVWLKRADLDENKSIRTYLYVLAKNEAINLMRRESRLKSLDEIASPADASGVQERVEYNETNDRVRRSVMGMPTQRKTIFEMSRIDNLSNKEISQILNLSVRTVEKHIELALKDIRKGLDS